MQKNVFFDFNGTIIDDVNLCLSLLNSILAKQEKRLLTVAEYKEIFTFPIKTYYERAGVDFTKESYEDLAKWFIANYQPASLKCGLYPNLIETLKRMKEKGYKLYILSASEKNNLIKQCEHYGITSYFEAILGIDNILATGKIDIALDYLAKNNLKGEDILFIGDTLHDLEVAKAMKAQCYLVSCGHQSYDILKQSGVKILNSVADLEDMLDD